MQRFWQKTLLYVFDKEVMDWLITSLSKKRNGWVCQSTNLVKKASRIERLSPQSVYLILWPIRMRLEIQRRMSKWVNIMTSMMAYGFCKRSSKCKLCTKNNLKKQLEAFWQHLDEKHMKSVRRRKRVWKRAITHDTHLQKSRSGYQVVGLRDKGHGCMLS